MYRLTACLALVLCAGFGRLVADVQAAEAHEGIGLFEQRWAEAVERNDPDEIGRFLYDDFTFVNPRGQLLDRAAHLDDFRERCTVFSKVELSEVQIRIYGDFAVVTSRPKITGFTVTPAGKTTFNAQPGRFTDTLIHRNDKWQSVARHMSLVSE
jgi:ketosteroid isomerase-like protein